MSRRSTIGTMIYLLLGPIAWGVHMTLAYAVQSTACALAGDAPPETAIRVFIVAITLIAVGVVAWGAAQPDRLATRLGTGAWPEDTARFQRQVMTLLALLSIFGLIAAGVGAVMLPVCAQLR